MNGAVEALGRVLIFGGAGVGAGVIIAAFVRSAKWRVVAAAIAILGASALATVLALRSDRDGMGSLAAAAVTVVMVLNTSGFVLMLGLAHLLSRRDIGHGSPR